MSIRFKTPAAVARTVPAMAETDRITDFLTAHARLLDRHRAALALGTGDPEAALRVLAGYQNADGGFGWGLEPDAREPASQPVTALHAFEVLEEVAPATSPMSVRLLDWLGTIGPAVPFALPGGGGPGSAPMWDAADTTTPSLHMTAVVAGIAHRVGRHDPAVAAHPWLQRTTAWCLDRIAAIDRPTDAIEFRYVLGLLDAIDARDELERLGAHLPASGSMAVTGGKPDEAMRPLDFSPEPDRPLRALFDPAVIEADLDRIEQEQHEDGGWDVDWAHWSPAGALEWRGWATVRALRILLANGRL